MLNADPSLAEADPDTLVPYFRYGFVPEPQTMFRNIKKLCAAHYLVYENGKVQTTPYWRLNFAEHEDAPVKHATMDRRIGCALGRVGADSLDERSATRCVSERWA